jgi:8-oxo-dGTP pyrophosphatase MutT (NUDIX family)
MDPSIFHQKDIFPCLVSEKLAAIPIDYQEKYQPIKYAGKTGPRQRGAGVVLLLHYKQINPGKAEYVFQLIKRSGKVSQSGDISCPGGMLHPGLDNFFSYLFSNRLLSSMPGGTEYLLRNKNEETINLIRLFLANALREAWEEIGLNPFNVIFLGALPSYSLSLFTRTIFPLVCLTPRPFEFKLSPEVEIIMEVPIRTFFESLNYAQLEIEMSFDNSPPADNVKYPCMVLSGNHGDKEILWGATYNIIMNFLSIISDNGLPVPSALHVVKKVLSESYISGHDQ